MVSSVIRNNKLSSCIHTALRGAGLGLLVCSASPVIGNEVHNGISDKGFEDDGVTLRVPASNTKVTLSGYVKGDFIYDDSSDLGDSFGFSSIPFDDTAEDDEDGHVRFHARQSRLRVLSETDIGSQKLKTQFEGDFFGGGGNETFSNSASFRIRHANVSIGNWTFGQGWTNFMDFVAYPSTLDFFGPIGKSFARQGMIKYAHSSGFSVSLENPDTDGQGLLGRLRESTGGAGVDRLPDLTAAWRGGPGGAGGSYEFSGVLRTLGVDGAIDLDSDGADDIDVDETEVGWGVNLAGGWGFGANSFSASVTFGDGIGRYIIGGAANDVFVNDDGSIDTVESFALAASYKRDWTANTSSLIAVGYFENDDPDASNGTEDIFSLHVNYKWAPFDGTTLGGELVYGDRTALGEDPDNPGGPQILRDGDAVRVLFSAQQNF